MRRDLKRIISAACGRGWSVELRKKSGHFKLTHPNGAVVFSASSPSDYRGLKNLEKQLERAER